MPMPERYRAAVEDIARFWTASGYFDAQTRIWQAECEAMSELGGRPYVAELERIRAALVLSPDDLTYLNTASGHETNRLLRLIQSRLGAEGNYLHRGNTSSDVLDTSLALQMIGSFDVLLADFRKLADVLQALSLSHAETLQIARSHGIHAVPHTFGRFALNWYAEVLDSLDRLQRGRAAISYGKLSGEVGTNIFIEPELEDRALALLGLKVDPASSQVITRTRHAEAIAMLALCASTCERIAVNIRLMQQTDVAEVQEPFDAASQQGSSAMPHKRNPELAERVCGLARRVRGALLEELESTALWYQRDISHSSTERFAIPDAFGCVAYMARLLHTGILSGLIVNEERMSRNIDQTNGAVYGSRLLNALLDTGAIKRTEAYDLVKRLAQRALDGGPHLREQALADPTVARLLPADATTSLFEPAFYLRNIRTAYRRLGLE
jgi:adenylosuccinate lyase